MSDSDKEKWFPSTASLADLRKAAIFYLGGGVILAALRFTAGKLALAIGAGGIILAVGLGWLMANNPNNKKTGAIITGIGVLVILSGIRISILPIVTGLILSIITIGSLVMGVKYLVLYFIAQSKHG